MPGHAASGVCEFASSRGFGLHSCPFSSLRLISPSHPTAGLQTGFLRMGLLWVSAPGTGPGISAIFWREVAAAGAGTRERRLLVLGPQPEVAGPPVQEQFQDPPLVGACTLPAAELPGQRCTQMCASCRARVRRRRGPPPRAALSGQTSRTIPHHLCGSVLEKPMALCQIEGYPSCPLWKRMLFCFGITNT